MRAHGTVSCMSTLKVTREKINWGLILPFLYFGPNLTVAFFIRNAAVTFSSLVTALNIYHPPGSCHLTASVGQGPLTTSGVTTSRGGVTTSGRDRILCGDWDHKQKCVTDVFVVKHSGVLKVTFGKKNNKNWAFCEGWLARKG